MSDYGITDEGFKRKKLDQILSEKNSDFKSIFGENFNVSPESPDGQINGVISESQSLLWELIESAYNGFNPSASTGVNLSNLVQINGITRLPASSSRVQLTVSGSIGALIPEGSLVSTVDTNTQFATEVDVTLDGAGNGTVFANSVETGPVAAASGTITNIDTPITGWLTVTNLADATLGANEETDIELRVRREQSVAQGSQAIIDAIFAAVANIEGVTNTTVLENDTDLVDANGLPPNSFQVIVVGGVDEDIGDQIWLNKPAGIRSFGSTTVQIDDSQGLEHNISFSRPTTVDIYVEVGLTKFSDYPADGDDLMKQAIVDYANGDLVQGRGFGLSEDVVYSRLYTPINSISGHSINTLKISKIDPPTGVIDIPIAATEISNFLVVNIDIV